jgi:hypothetical protein
VVGSTSNLLLIPIPFLIALWIFPRYVIQTSPKCLNLTRIRQRILPKRQALLARYFSASELKRLQETREQLERNRLAGDISVNDYQVLKSELEAQTSQSEKDSDFDEQHKLKDVIIGVGLAGTQWTNGLWAARKGLIVSLFFSALYLWERLQRFVELPTAFRLLEIIFPLLVFFSYWLVCAFFFGYFFTCFRGNSGLRKGLNVACAVILCLFPIWLFSFSSPLALFLRAGQTFLFFSFLGFIADYQIFREALGDKFEWRKLTQFEEIANFTAFASVLIAGLGTTAGKAVTGHFDVIIKDLVDMTFQKLPKLPF